MKKIWYNRNSAPIAQQLSCCRQEYPLETCENPVRIVYPIEKHNNSHYVPNHEWFPLEGLKIGTFNPTADKTIPLRQKMIFQEIGMPMLKNKCIQTIMSWYYNHSYKYLLYQKLTVEQARMSYWCTEGPGRSWIL